MKFKPVLFVGLGAEGISLASVAMKEVWRRNAGRERLVRGLGISDDLAVQNLENGQNVVAAAPAVDKSYSALYNAALAQEEALDRAIVDAIGELRDHDVWIDLVEKGTDIDEVVRVAIFTPLFGSGSALLIPTVYCIDTMLQRRQLARLEIELYGFCPDLFENVRRDQEAYARAYACLQELYWVADEGPLPILASSMTYLFTLRNESRIEMSSPEVLGKTIGAVLDLLVKGDVAGDRSFDHVLLRKVDGRKARYTSFGLSTLVLPIDEMMTALHGAFASEVLTAGGFLSTEVYERQRVGLDVTKFIYDQKYDDPESQLRMGPDGRPIWVEFTSKGGTERELAEHCIARLAQEAMDFERGPLSAMLRKLHDRASGAIDLQRQQIEGAAAERIDSSGTRYAQAFLAAFQNQNVDVLRGEFIGDILTIDDLDSRARKFFDKELGIDRKRFARLRSDYELKQTALKEMTAELEQLEAQPEAEDPEAAGTAEVDRDAAVNALQTRISAIKKEEQKLLEEYAPLAEKVKNHDLALNDGTRRRQLLEKLRAGEDEQRAAAEKLLRDCDVTLRQAKAHFDAVRARGRAWLVRRFVILMAGAVGAFLLAWFIHGYVPPEATNYWPIARKAIGIGGATYILWSIYVFFTVIKPDYDEAARRVENAIGDKKNAQHALELFYKDSLRKTFDYTVHSLLIDWAIVLRKTLDAVAQQVDAFVGETVKFCREGADRFAQVTFTSSNVVRYIVTGEYVRKIPAATPRFAEESRMFFSRTARSSFLRDFLAAGKVDSLEQALVTKAEEVFRDVRHGSVESVLAKTENVKLLRERGKNLVSFASPFVELDVEPGADGSQVIRYVGTTEPESSVVLAELGKEAIDCSAYQSDDPTTVALTTLKVGFPDFQVAPIHQAEHLALGHDAWRYRVTTDWPLKPLFPTVYTVGSEDDEARKIACQAIALGLVQQANGRDFVLEGSSLGDSFWAFVQNLRGLRGAGAKVRLEIKIQEARKLPDASEKIMQKLADPDLDEIDRRILESVLEELNPL